MLWKRYYQKLMKQIFISLFSTHRRRLTAKYFHIRTRSTIFTPTKSFYFHFYYAFSYELIVTLYDYNNFSPRKKEAKNAYVLTELLYFMGMRMKNFFIETLNVVELLMSHNFTRIEKLLPQEK